MQYTYINFYWYKSKKLVILVFLLTVSKYVGFRTSPDTADESRLNMIGFKGLADGLTFHCSGYFKDIDRNTLALCLQVFTGENYIQKINDGGVFGINVGRESYTLIISDGIFSLE